LEAHLNSYATLTYLTAAQRGLHISCGEVLCASRVVRVPNNTAPGTHCSPSPALPAERRRTNTTRRQVVGNDGGVGKKWIGNRAQLPASIAAPQWIHRIVLNERVRS
jgi:hypothetical protein